MMVAMQRHSSIQDCVRFGGEGGGGVTSFLYYIAITAITIYLLSCIYIYIYIAQTIYEYAMNVVRVTLAIWVCTCYF